MRLSVLLQETLKEYEKHYSKKDYLAAAQQTDALLASNLPTPKGNLYFLSGKAYFYAKEYRKAVKCFGIAVGYSPNQLEYHLFYAKSLEKIGHVEEANLAFEQAEAASLSSEILARSLQEITETMSDLQEHIQKMKTKKTASLSSAKKGMFDYPKAADYLLNLWKKNDGLAMS